MADWLSRKEKDFIEMCNHWGTVLGNEENIVRFKLDAGKCDGLLQKVTVYLDAVDAYSNADTSVNKIAKQEAKMDLRVEMRKFANSWVRYNEEMDDTIKQFLGIPMRDATPTLHPRPTSQPNTVALGTLNNYEHKVKAENRGSRGPVKPADAYGVKYAWQVGGEMPLDAEDLPKSQFSRRTSLVITHKGRDKGKAVWYATRYENSRGEGGPWSPIVEAYIG